MQEPITIFCIYRVCIKFASLVKSISDKLGTPLAIFLLVRALVQGHFWGSLCLQGLQGLHYPCNFCLLGRCD